MSKKKSRHIRKNVPSTVKGHRRMACTTCDEDKLICIYDSTSELSTATAARLWQEHEDGK